MVDDDRTDRPPAGPNSSEPQLTASDRGIILSWVERAGAGAPQVRRTYVLRLERTHNGGIWQQLVPELCGPANGSAPSQRYSIANWLVSTNPDYEGNDLQVSYSQDNGKTWARPFVPHHDGTEQQHAFASFFELPGNVLGVSWLDGRDTQPSDANPNGGPMALRYAAYDAQWKRTAEGVVDQQACECCSTMAAMTSEGVRSRSATGPTRRFATSPCRGSRMGRGRQPQRCTTTTSKCTAAR